MKRTLFALCSLLLACTAGAYHAWPGLFKEPLLQMNRALSGLEEKTIRVAGHDIHYLEGGQGETPIVLLHGIFAEKDHRTDFARSLTDQHRILAPDLPGFGESSRHEGEAYDYAAQTERLRALLDALGLARVHLAGSSMGGTLAALLALQHPERVASVAFVGAPHGIRSARPSAMDRLIDQGQAPLVAHDAASFEAMMELVFEKRPFLPYPIVHAAQAEALRNAPSNMRLWQAQLKDRYLLQDRIDALRAPTLVLWGGRDHVFDATGAEVLRTHLPQAHISVLPDLGHLPMMEAPGDAAHLYAEFLQSLAQPVAPGNR